MLAREGKTFNTGVVLLFTHPFHTCGEEAGAGCLEEVFPMSTLRLPIGRGLAQTSGSDCRMRLVMLARDLKLKPAV